MLIFSKADLKRNISLLQAEVQKKDGMLLSQSSITLDVSSIVSIVILVIVNLFCENNYAILPTGYYVFIVNKLSIYLTIYLVYVALYFIPHFRSID